MNEPSEGFSPIAVSGATLVKIMSTTTETSMMLRTPFHEFHVNQRAKMVEFAGWEMPMLYHSIIDEHRQVRAAGGVFDVSHMGRLRFTGRDACRFLDHVCTRQIFGLADDQARYSLVCNEQGGCHDDVLVYFFGDDEYMMVCNAANRLKLLDHFQRVRGDFEFELHDETAETGMLAIQGPKVMELIKPLAPEVTELKRYRFLRKDVLGATVLVSRTGYTGEDGVEIIMPAALAAAALGFLVGDMDADNSPVKPAGLGARDTLRLEAGMPLYGHEITEDFDPLAAGLKFAVKLDKGDDNPDVGHFIGQDALRRIAQDGPTRRLVGLFLDGKRTARQEMKVMRDGAEIGFVTSGCASPTLGKSIAMAFVGADHAEPGTTVQVDLGRTMARAEVVKLPFYKAG